MRPGRDRGRPSRHQADIVACVSTGDAEGLVGPASSSSDDRFGGSPAARDSRLRGEVADIGQERAPRRRRPPQPVWLGGRIARSALGGSAKRYLSVEDVCDGMGFMGAAMLPPPNSWASERSRRVSTLTVAVMPARSGSSS